MFSHTKILYWIVIIAFASGGCAVRPSKSSSPDSVDVLQCIEGWGCVNGAANTPMPILTSASQPSASHASQPKTPSISAQPREMFLTQVQGEVSVQETPDGIYAPAYSGMLIPIDSSIQTEVSGLASLSTQPDGTIIRIGPNSLLAIKSLTSNPRGKPDIYILLNAGKLWALPQGGIIVIKTNSGTAFTDEGSPLGVSYDPETATLQASCLQGLCSLGNEEGNIILTSGMMALISAGELPYSSQQMDGQNLQEWADENPDLQNYFGGQVPGWIPTPNH